MSCIEINLDQVIKELLWIEDALANGYRKTIVLLKDYGYLLTMVILKSHDEMETTAYWHTYPTEWDTMRGRMRENIYRRVETKPVMF